MPRHSKAVVIDGIRKTFGSVVAFKTFASTSGAARYSVYSAPTGRVRQRW
jgi:hypothetical protein